MATGGQISALHIAIAASGGVLLYAALRGVTPLVALKDVTSGAPPAVSTKGKKITRPDGSLDPDFVPGGYGTEDWKGVYKKSLMPFILRRPSVLVTAVGVAHGAEKYSQSKRWSRGHSDCSSFIGKGLLDIGIEPPGNSVTTDYMKSPDWLEVTNPRMGDIAVNSSHMALFIDGQNGIGQQNPKANVRRDTVDNLMANTGDGYRIYRYRGWS